MNPDETEENKESPILIKKIDKLNTESNEDKADEIEDIQEEMIPDLEEDLDEKKMEEQIDTKNQQKLKFDNSEYLIDDLPKEAKQLVMGLRTADAQTKMYEDTLKLIALGKNKMVQDLKMILDKIEPIQNA